MSTSGYTYTTFTINKKEYDNAVSTIYAVVYYREKTPKFLCLSPTFMSAKGEF